MQHPQYLCKILKIVVCKIIKFLRLVYVLNQPVNKQNHFNLESLNEPFHVYKHIFKIVCVI